MNYKDILLKQKNNLHEELQWWPNFFYHFTDVHNALSIIKTGWIMSREKAIEQGIMANDNASRAVIGVTDDQNKRYGRLYFRPLTPTQYHNEGYKPQQVRKPEVDANCPVPIFFCLNAVSIMSLPNTKFAEQGIAGGNYCIKQGAADFSKLNFAKIYHEGSYNTQNDGDIQAYRRSEIINEDGFPLEPSLMCILCRTIAEKEMLLYLLKSYSLRTYNSYRERILYKPKLKCFYNNGIFIKNTRVLDDVLYLELNDPQQRAKQGLSDIYFEVKVDLTYRMNNGQVVYSEERYAKFNYLRVGSISLMLRSGIHYDLLWLNVYFDGCSMYENEIEVSDKKVL